MTLQDLGSVGEFVGAVGVVVSLVYLAMQIRQNTAHLRQNTLAAQTAAYHQAVEQSWNAMLTSARDPQLADLVVRGCRDQAELSDEERARFEMILSPQLYCFENLLHAYERGELDRERWENALMNTLPWMRQPGFLAFARTRSGPLSRRLVAAIDREVAGGTGAGA
ncbi:MAG: hypothetical protein ABFS41_02095 [Myxococcota bacterium]